MSAFNKTMSERPAATMTVRFVKPHKPLHDDDMARMIEALCWLDQEINVPGIETMIAYREDWESMNLDAKLDASLEIRKLYHQFMGSD